MNPYRDKPIEHPKAKPRHWFKTFKWKLKLFTSGSFKSRYERCKNCKQTVARVSGGDHLGHAFIWLYHDRYDCKVRNTLEHRSWDFES